MITKKNKSYLEGENTHQQSPKLDMMKPSCVCTRPYKTKINHTILEGEKEPITSQQSWIR
jgi:hypothetical protein